MMRNAVLPRELNTMIGSERKEFAVKAGRAKPLKSSIALIIGFFVIIGIALLLGGIYSVFRKGGYFVGTPLRFIHYYKGNMRSIDWEQFSGDIEVNGNINTGNISLHMRTGKMVSRKNGPDRYFPDVIYMSKIPDAFEIERICRKRIKENDPTPPNDVY